ncbi:hypothetical protein GPL20_00895 [Bradyrhizobium cajani]|uniref:Uncharacterized protein n=1 Tax=Bradyrhizobium cajani TaxID=1928661 RepID=A0A844T260_9BRAD|nr:hypothetical protein [Bradyrhizobium cajani]
MGAEQRQEQRNFFLRTDLDHDYLLFAPLVGARAGGVQDNRVSALFQACFVGARRGPSSDDELHPWQTEE